MEEGTATKHSKSKRSREEKREKHKKHEALGDDGTSQLEKKERKKKRKAILEHGGDIADGGGTSVHTGDAPPSAEKKRKREPDEAGIIGSTAQTKEKKKRKKNVDAVESPEITQELLPSDAGTVKKDKKKHKKDSVAASASANTALPSSSAPSHSDIEAFLAKHSITIHSSNDVEQVMPIIRFDQLDIPAELRSAFAGFKEPSPIQACSWPPALKGRDVVGIAETGSGKTLAFGLPALVRLVSDSPPKSKKGKGATTVSVLVVAPTRELAIQTHETLSALGEPFGIASVAVFGGVDKAPQVKSLKNANKDGKTTRIIVGTPGRILDLVNDGACDLSRVTYLVLDEADRMLDTGFENAIRSIIGHTTQGAERQTLMFSATWPEAVRRLASTFQRNPEDLTANSRVEQIFDDARSKDSRLLAQLRALSHKKSAASPDEARILVFVLYKKEASRVESMLHSKGYTVGGLHGDLSQAARMQALQNFKSGVTGLLVATDVAARGLDIPNVAAVRRGGKTGKSITFFTGDDHERALAGELARVLRESGFEAEGLKKFPMTIKKKTHSAYGAFFRDDIPTPSGPTKIVFD
ncbi:P-loop containing nucleoside triphosphate hydrolase protein [Amylocystis lapponica]|nr:P-loop containing nucleoside triphosphate hydrolase protein [Amylocystis lapponica]